MKNKTNFLAIVFVAIVAIALAVANEWITLETFKETAFAVSTVIIGILALWKTLESEELKTEVKKKDAEIYRQNNYINQLENKR